MSLKISILSHEPSPTVMENVIPVARARGHEVSVVDFAECMLTNFSHDPVIESVVKADVVYYRTSGLDSIISSSLCARLRARSVLTLNGVYDLHPNINRKSCQAILAESEGIMIPKTYVDARPSFEKIAHLLGAPFIAKLDISSQGRDVHLVRNEKDFAALPFAVSTNGYVYQEYIPHECDYRVHMLGAKAAATYRRVPAEGDFRANVSRGGAMELVDDEKKKTLFALAEKLAPRFGLDICAIDFLHSTKNGELYFAETNLNPGWEASDERATGVNLTEHTIDYIETKARKN